MVMGQQLKTCSNVLLCFLGLRATVFDWTRLGVFTGSRISEYGQSQLESGERYSTTPVNPDVPDSQRGYPIAFVAADFTFFDNAHNVVGHSTLFAHHQQGQVQGVRIRF